MQRKTQFKMIASMLDEELMTLVYQRIMMIIGMAYAMRRERYDGQR